MYLLDTCTFLWLVADQPRISNRALGCVRTRPGSLFVSAISAFEIALRHAYRKLHLPLAPATWWREALAFHGVVEIPVSGELGAEAALLPPIHNDPCDRIIVATAQSNSLVILTPDSRIGRYPGIRVVW